MSRMDILNLFDKNGILPTPQRIEVAEILLTKAQHLSADQILDHLKAAGSGVSKATVYNTLNLFAARGIVKEIMVDPIRKFYDSTTHAHHHFYNLDTGELRDIESDAISFSDLPEAPDGTRMDGVEVLITVRDEA